MRDDGPDPPITRSHSPVGSGRDSSASRVRMIIAANLRSAFTRNPMRINQRLRIDFEMGFRRWMDVLRCNVIGDTLTLAQQKPAAFMGVGRLSLSLQRFNNVPCHFDMHRAWQ